MQNRFVLKAKTAARRLAAVATTSAMLGATAFSAVAAADLADYPAPFVANGQWAGLIVVGSDAAAPDIVGATDIAATLSQQAVTAAGTGTSSISGGVQKEIPLGFRIANTSTSEFLDAELDDEDVAGLADGSITFQSTSYDYRDKIVFHNATATGTNDKGPIVHTSLSSSEDDYKSGVYIEADRANWGYYYVFDTSINISKATSADPLRIEFLGRTLTITSVDLTTDGKFTARVGEEHFLNVGDSVTVSGKTVTLENVASSGSTVVIDVDGVRETVTNTETVNGIEINVADTFYADAKAERSATLVIGIDAVETYNDGDKFFEPCATAWKTANCKKEDPDWIWDTANFGASAAGAVIDYNANSGGPVIGVVNDYIINDDGDNPITVGGVYDLPLGGYELRFDGLTVADNNYVEYTVRWENSYDLTDIAAYSAKSSEPVFVIESSSDEGLKVASSGKKTNRVVIWINDSLAASTASAGSTTNLTDIFYRDPSNGKLKLDQGINLSWGTPGAAKKIAEIDYDETKGTNIAITLAGSLNTSATDNINLTFDIIADSTNDVPDRTDDIQVLLGHTAHDSATTAGEFNSLGASVTSEEANELKWGAIATPIGTKDEDHRTRYGIIIKDPKGNGAGDRVKMQIPNDQVKAKISVVGPGSTVTTATGTSVTVQSVSGVPVAKLDTEVTDKTGSPLILVGGPAVNRLTAEALGLTYPTYGAASTVPENKALLSLVDNAFGGTNTALVVAGWNAGNTRDAANVLKDYSSYSLSGTSMEVSSSGGVISVAAPTVATTTTEETTAAT